MAYEDFKDLTRRTTYEKILHNKTFIIAKYPKYDRYHRGIASMVYKFFFSKKKKLLLMKQLKMKICQTKS